MINRHSEGDYQFFAGYPATSDVTFLLTKLCLAVQTHLNQRSIYEAYTAPHALTLLPTPYGPYLHIIIFIWYSYMILF
jgi:hypothetical protein